MVNIVPLRLCGQPIITNNSNCDHVSLLRCLAIRPGIVPYVFELRVPTSLVTRKSMYFPGYFLLKAMKSQFNLYSNHSVCVDNVDMTNMYKIFANEILKWILNINFKFFSGFELKSHLFPLLSIFQASFSPGKVNDKIPGF